MRLALLTDVHSNTEALGAVLADVRKRNVDALIHLGDVVGYGAEPNECCAILRREAQLSLLGNHDAVVVGRMDKSWFASHARVAAEWTSGLLLPEHGEWLARAPYTYRERDYLFSHGSPVAPEQFRYVLSRGEAEDIFAWSRGAGVRVVFVGHAHQCFAFHDGAAEVVEVDGIEHTELDVSAGRWVINVGSVGQPRDGDPRACYGVVDLDAGRYEAYRIPYDVEAAAAKIRAAGLPEVLSARLALGR